MSDTHHESIACVNSVFEQPWWLEAVAPGRWGAVTVTEGGRIVARMPYVTKKKFGLTALTMPPLTQTLGPWLQPSESKYTNRLAVEQALMEKLIAQLPRFDFFAQNFSSEITNWLPFYWTGFQQTTLYTYRLENLKDMGSIWDGMRQSVRTSIRKAQKAVSVRTDLGINRLLELNAQVFMRQQVNNPYDPQVVQRLDAACTHNNCRKLFFAEDSQGCIHAALYIVWDDHAVHCLMSGANPILRTSDAGSLLWWTAIQFAATVARAFDFTGSMIKPIEKHLRSYGGKQVPYFSIRKMSPRMKVLWAARDVWDVVCRK